MEVNSDRFLDLTHTAPPWRQRAAGRRGRLGQTVADKTGVVHRRLQDVPHLADALLQRGQLPRGPENLVPHLRHPGQGDHLHLH